MLEIDCSRGEGGGQSVRTSVAMSTVTGKEVHLTRIRENRPTNGLSKQHCTAVQAVADVIFHCHNIDVSDLLRIRIFNLKMQRVLIGAAKNLDRIVISNCVK